jgi:hypothetical protein
MGDGRWAMGDRQSTIDDRREGKIDELDGQDDNE